MLQQRAAGLRRRHALTAAQQQRGAQRLFHVADTRGGRREREVGAPGAMGDAARLDHVAEQAEVGKVEAQQRSLRGLTKARYAKY